MGQRRLHNAGSAAVSVSRMMDFFSVSQNKISFCPASLFRSLLNSILQTHVCSEVRSVVLPPFFV
jgi:hypothetical protein